SREVDTRSGIGGYTRFVAGPGSAERAGGGLDVTAALKRFLTYIVVHHTTYDTVEQEAERKGLIAEGIGQTPLPVRIVVTEDLLRRAKARVLNVLTCSRIFHQRPIRRADKSIAIYEIGAGAVVRIIVRRGVVDPFADIGEEIGGHIPADAVGIDDGFTTHCGFPAVVGICITIDQVSGIARCIRDTALRNDLVPIAVVGNVQ